MGVRAIELAPSDILNSVRMDDVQNAAGPFIDGDWFQLAKTGTFFSPVYGKITISPADLSTMYTNFKTKTPKAPTQLPIDYDHLSDEPQKPEDGKAAGWVKDLQIRDGGDTLWCLPSWTKRAAEMIANGEYRFVSPFFLTDYLDKDSGKKIGPTLKAVAITNRPFLEGMQPIPAPAIAASDRRLLAKTRRPAAIAASDQHEEGGVASAIYMDSRCSRCGAPAPCGCAVMGKLG